MDITRVQELVDEANRIEVERAEVTRQVDDVSARAEKAAEPVREALDELQKEANALYARAEALVDRQVLVRQELTAALGIGRASQEG